MPHPDFRAELEAILPGHTRASAGEAYAADLLLGALVRAQQDAYTRGQCAMREEAQETARDLGSEEIAQRVGRLPLAVFT